MIKGNNEGHPGVDIIRKLLMEEIKEKESNKKEK
jgi:hypothetical protein